MRQHIALIPLLSRTYEYLTPTFLMQSPTLWKSSSWRKKYQNAMFSIKVGAFFFLHSTVYAAKIGNLCLEFRTEIYYQQKEKWTRIEIIPRPWLNKKLRFDQIKYIVGLNLNDISVNCAIIADNLWLCITDLRFWCLVLAAC